MATKRPNIVVILADDMGFSDLGCYGGEIATPNLDRLAAGGLRFTQFYNTARCCPTRASLLTGPLPAPGRRRPHGRRTSGRAGLPRRPERPLRDDRRGARARGLLTAMRGKWHVGEKRPHWPVDRGFDRYYGTITGGGSYFDPTRLPRQHADLPARRPRASPTTTTPTRSPTSRPRSSATHAPAATTSRSSSTSPSPPRTGRCTRREGHREVQGSSTMTAGTPAPKRKATARQGHDARHRPLAPRSTPAGLE